MEGNSWRPAQGEPSAADAAAGDWRSQLQHDARERIVKKIMDTLKRHLPISVPEGLNELQKIAVRFEEKIYSLATSQPDYLRKISLKMLSMETKSQHTPPINSSMPNTTIPNQNPTDQVGNRGPSLAIPIVNPSPARQQLLPQNLQNNTSTAVQSSANLPSALSSIAGLGQSNISSVGQTSNLQNMSGISQNSLSNSVGQGAAPDIYANVQRQMQGRQYQQHVTSEQQQQSQNQLIYQHQLQQQLLKQKLQHSSLLQLHMQQQQQEQSLLRPMQLQSSQQSLIQMPSGLQSGQSTIQQAQPTTRQSAGQPVFQQIQLNSIQQSVPSLLQQHTQSVARQQQQQEAQPSIHQQSPSLQRQPTPVPQQSNLQQQQIVGQQADISNMQQAQLLGQQSSVQDMQRPWQQRWPVQQNSLLGMQQPQQMLNQQSIYLHQEQQLGPQISLLGLQQQQLQQQQLLGFLANVSNVQPHQHSVHILQQPKMVTQQQQQTQQTPLALLQPQGQESQHQSSPQQLISQIQSEPVQLQQQLAMQQQPNSLQQGFQTPSALLRSQNAIEQQKHFIQAQRVLRDVSSNTSVDSIAQTGDAGVADLQEEIYQKIKSWREMYFTDLNEFYQKVALKLQQHDALIPPAKPSEQYEKMKTFKTMLEHTLVILQISKNNIQPGLKEKLPLYERQIHNVLASTKKKGIPSQSQGQQQFQHPSGLAHSMPQQQPSQVSQLQLHDNHPNQMQQMNLQVSATSMQPSAVTGMQHVSMPLPTNFGVPTTQQNITNALQPAANLDSVQGSSFNSLQQGAVGSMQQGGVGSVPSTVNAPQQTNTNTLSNSSMNTLQPNASLVQPSSNTIQQQYVKQQRQDQQWQLMQREQMKQQLQDVHHHHHLDSFFFIFFFFIILFFFIVFL